LHLLASACRPTLVGALPVIGSQPRGAEISNDPDHVLVRAQIERARRGETEAFGALFGSFGADVARLCARMLGSGADAEDAASETFLRARRAIDDYDATRPFRTWLLAIAAHRCIDRLRQRTREQKLFAPTELDAETLPHPGPSPLRGELDGERRRAVTRAIDQLPERYRAPLVLRYFAEQSYLEIGVALELSEAQVGMLLYRARRKLRELLTEGSPE